MYTGDLHLAARFLLLTAGKYYFGIYDLSNTITNSILRVLLSNSELIKTNCLMRVFIYNN